MALQRHNVLREEPSGWNAPGTAASNLDDKGALEAGAKVLIFSVGTVCLPVAIQAFHWLVQLRLHKGPDSLPWRTLHRPSSGRAVSRQNAER
jgi:hypothetical protein